MSETMRYRGRISQTGICLGKLLRMFVYQNDWKVLPMSALIAGLVTFAVGNNIYVTQEGTLSGCFALVCVCIWNGFFNSIQSVCRERPIIKREHRSGLHISSYIAAHMIYQMMLCAMQTIILITISSFAGISFPKDSLITGNFYIDLGISLFLVTYAADMISLAISCLVKNTTTAMTVMPFMAIFQLVFSGGLVFLEGPAKKLTGLTITRWGLESLCTLGNYNSLPMVTLWNTIWKFRSMEIDGIKPIELLTDKILEEGKLDYVLLQSGMYNTNPAYVYAAGTVLKCWGILILFIILFAGLSILLLEFIDKDKR
ncbi:MAG: ABC transporter permease [Solobacterium sp.]|nr:ABC transporter permease [Solobacterium sp.]